MSKIQFPNIETASAAAHQRWIEQRRAQGATSEVLDDTKEELMVDYAQLSETAKGLVRTQTQATFEAIEHHGVPSGSEIEHVCETAQERWVEARRSAGATSETLDDTKEELMVPYAQLSDRAKDLVRVQVNAVIEMVRSEAQPLAAS